MTSASAPAELRTETAWHALSAEEALAHLGASAEGLSSAEAARRLVRDGPNALRITPPVPALAILIDQVRSLIVLLLAAAAALSLATGDVADAIAIGVVLAINIGIGFATELRARRSMEALRSLDIGHARTLRDGEPTQLDARELVAGDVVLLEPGDAVPADLRLLRAVELSANEAPLTGESMPVRKRAQAVPAQTLLAERSGMLHKGTLLSVGTGVGLVVATGVRTQIGAISELVATVEEDEAPLEKRLDALGRRLVGVSLGVAALVSALGLLRGGELWLMLETGIALAVAAVPEGLPVVATITLAVGMARMARRRALVRRLPAVEALGSVTVVCTDKTGTLTAGEMTATALLLPGSEVPGDAPLMNAPIGDALPLATPGDEPLPGVLLSVSGAGYAPDGALLRDGSAYVPSPGSAAQRALQVAVLCNRAALVPPETGSRDEEGADAGSRWTIVGDPTEAALLTLGAKAGQRREQLLDGQAEVGELPFNSERMLMATFHSVGGAGLRACVKGAPERVLARCTAIAGGAHDGAHEDARAAHEGALAAGGDGSTASAHFDHPRSMDEPARARWLDANRRLASSGLRVLALAERALPAGVALDETSLEQLTLLGLVGFRDPPAAGVKQTIATLHGAGIRTVMITGDQSSTAEAVARELGLLEDDGEVIDGARLAAAGEHGLPALLEHASAFSRVSPADKLAIVRGFQARGEVVGMLGDGVNDAAALKGADIGVAMGGRGTDVAKETADVVLVDDRFDTIAAAVEGGRVIDENIRKVVFYLFAGNLAEVAVLLAAGLVGLPLPLLPLQILWINLVSDLAPALALSMEPAEAGIMRRPPRPEGTGLLSRRFAWGVAFHSSLVGLPALAVFLWRLQSGDAREAGTLAFLVLGLAQCVHTFSVRRREGVPMRQVLRGTPWLWSATAVSIALMLVAVLVPSLARVLGCAAVSPADWLLVCLASLTPLSAAWLRSVRHPVSSQC